MGVASDDPERCPRFSPELPGPVTATATPVLCHPHPPSQWSETQKGTRIIDANMPLPRARGTCDDVERELNCELQNRFWVRPTAPVTERAYTLNTVALALKTTRRQDARQKHRDSHLWPLLSYHVGQYGQQHLCGAYIIYLPPQVASNLQILHSGSRGGED
jgi:hypothetical protein